MKDISQKSNTLRSARATATLHCLPSTIAVLHSPQGTHAEALSIARMAAVQAAKNTATLIPTSHQSILDHVEVEFELKEGAIHIYAEVKASAKTSLDTEALVAATIAATTLYCQFKAADETMEIDSVHVVETRGGTHDVAEVDTTSLRAGVLVMSDRGARHEREDLSGKAIKEQLELLGLAVVEYKILPDEADQIESELLRLSDDARVDLVITTGGTGLGPRDVTPEVTARVIEKSLPGVGEVLRTYGQARTGYAMLSRGVAGIRGKTLIINLPGSLGAVTEAMHVLIPWILHSFPMMKGEGH
ncbi:MAG: bifunctional molybdenum cofactor biosynthesis protein MoaC/MoaB [Bacteroidota bacterium]